MSDNNEEEFEGNQLRPKVLKEYIGQEGLKQKVSIAISAAKKRGSAIDHILFYGPPGLGKTTISNLIANEMEVGFKSQSAPSIERTGDLLSLLITLEENDILFIDEIHRLPKYVEEVLYSAMEDFFVEIITDVDNEKKAIKITLPRFTLIGATTRPGMLSAPLKDRFGIQEKLEYYTEEELSTIVKRGSRKVDFDITDVASDEIGKRGRGTPRIALRLMKRLHDFALSEEADLDDREEVDKALTFMSGLDSAGLDEHDKHYLRLLKDYGPISLKNLASMMSEDEQNITDFIEPYLMQKELIRKTTRGRILTDKGLILV